jgi:pSer/pThr/pTyr-binding forkhead associated (FHA) protein
MIAALALVVVLLVGFIIYSLMSSKSKTSGSSGSAQYKSTPRATTTSSSAASAPDDDEVTRVRVAGPRLIRTMGGLKVGDEMAINGVITIGRGGASTIKFNDAEMSSVHAEFRVEGDKAMVTDLGSTNGSFLNSARIDDHVSIPLNDGDQIKLGTTVFIFKQFQ